MEATGEAYAIAARIDALDLWKTAKKYNWAIKLSGVAFPYFCTTIETGEGCRALYMLEGWDTFHHWVLQRHDPDFGFYSSWVELPHFEMISRPGGEIELLHAKPGYYPEKVDKAGEKIVARLLWQCYGILMRVEGNPKEIFKFADRNAMFGRMETSPGVWEDHAFEIKPPRPYVEEIAIRKSALDKAKDMPVDKNETAELDFRMIYDERFASIDLEPRYCYRLSMALSPTGKKVLRERLAVEADVSIKQLWESIPQRVLDALVARGRIPGQICVANMRMFRLMRSLGMELPFKLSLKESLPAVRKMH